MEVMESMKNDLGEKWLLCMRKWHRFDEVISLTGYITLAKAIFTSANSISRACVEITDLPLVVREIRS